MSLYRASVVVDALNRQGKFAAHLDPTTKGGSGQIVIRHVDTGNVAARLYLPAYDGDFYEWFAAPFYTARRHPGTATLEELVRALATALLDEAVKRP
ncbi:hypothetical protein ACXJJ3_26760 [Kribbella sp. WER1]